MNKFRKTFLAIVGVICLACLNVPSVMSANSELPKNMTITCYPMGTLGNIIGTALSIAIEKETGIRTKPTPADTDLGRVLPVKIGEASFALITAATVYTASTGKIDFAKMGPQRLRQVFGGNAIQHGFAVRQDSGIKKWSDLKGKRVALPPGFFGMTVPAFLAYGNLTLDDVVVVKASGMKDSIKMIMQGRADTGHVPPMTPLVKEWEAAPYGLRYLPMDKNDKLAWERMKKYAPFMAAPFWTEYGALGEGGAKWLAYYPYTLSTYKNIDETLVYTVVKALDEGYALFKNVKKPETTEWTLDRTLDTNKPVYIPFHPGLIKYAKEKGKWTPQLEAWQANALKAENERIHAWKSSK